MNIMKSLIIWLCFIPVAILNGGLREDCRLIGICWTALTIAFEFIAGLADGNTMTELLTAYNPLTGNLWLLVLATTLLSPIVTKNFKIRSKER